MVSSGSACQRFSQSQDRRDPCMVSSGLNGSYRCKRLRTLSIRILTASRSNARWSFAPS